MATESIRSMMHGVWVSCVGTLGSGAGALWTWLGENNESIGSVVMILGLCITFAGYIHTRRQGRKR